MTETNQERVARLAAELEAANADLNAEREAAAHTRRVALTNIALSVLTEAPEKLFNAIYEVSDLNDLPIEALLEDYETDKMNLVISGLCERKERVSAGYRIDAPNEAYPNMQTVAVTVLVPRKAVEHLLDAYPTR